MHIRGSECAKGTKSGLGRIPWASQWGCCDAKGSGGAKCPEVGLGGGRRGSLGLAAEGARGAGGRRLTLPSPLPAAAGARASSASSAHAAILGGQRAARAPVPSLLHGTPRYRPVPSGGPDPPGPPRRRAQRGGVACARTAPGGGGCQATAYATRPEAPARPGAALTGEAEGKGAGPRVAGLREGEPGHTGGREPGHTAGAEPGPPPCPLTPPRPGPRARSERRPRMRGGQGAFRPLAAALAPSDVARGFESRRCSVPSGTVGCG